jgi:hypothetical protein
MVVVVAVVVVVIVEVVVVVVVVVAAAVVVLTSHSLHHDKDFPSNITSPYSQIRNKTEDSATLKLWMKDNTEESEFQLDTVS